MASLTHREQSEKRQAENRHKIRKDLRLDSIRWQWHFTSQFPGGYLKDRYLARRELDVLCRHIDRTHHIRLIAVGVIVYRRGCSPHAHLLLASLPIPNGNNLADLDPKEVLSTWHYPESRITTSRQWPQRSARGYITAPQNMNLTGTRTDEFDIFRFNFGRLKQHASSLKSRRKQP